MSAFVGSKLDSELIAKAVNALFKYETKKANEKGKSKSLLMANYAKSVLVQVCFQSNSLRFYIYE